MKKKSALVLTSLLILTLLLTTPSFTPSATSFDEPSPGPGPVYHWKIMLAQASCNAWIVGYLTLDGVPIEGTDFFLNCTCDLPEPQPKGQFVFWKVATPVVPDDIHYWKYIDEDKNPLTPPIEIFVNHPIPYFDPEYDYLIPEEPHTWYQHVEEGQGPFGPWMVVVEVREQPYDQDRPFFEWQIMMKTHGGIPTSFSGYLTYFLDPLPGTDFWLKSSEADPDLQCQVVRTPYCTVPNDIHGYLDPFGITIDEDIHQFPWTKRVWIDPPFVYVDLELTEVQMHTYVGMGGETTSDGQLGTFAPWNRTLIYPNGDPGYPVPFATRKPTLTSLLMTQNITFTQRDPITGIVKIGVPWESYVGLDHTYFSPRVGTYFRVRIFLETQGCGWIFTGIGKKPILGAVDLFTYDNNTGCYTFGPDGVDGTADDELLAGLVSPTHPAYEAAGAGPPLGPCLQELRGPDDIPGTADDPIGRGDPDGPDEPGSSILYLPTTMETTFWDGVEWQVLFTSPWPQLMTTGTSYDQVIEQGSAITGYDFTVTGEPWEFFARLDHPEYGIIPWKHKKCNAYVTYACVWSVLDTATAMGDLDVHFWVVQKLVRQDCLIADIDCNELVDIVDIVICALAFGAKDEGFGNPTADPNFDARGDLSAARGLIDIVDIVRIAINFGWKLTPNCIIKP